MIKSSAIIARKEEGILYTRSCMTEMANFSKDFLLLMVTDKIATWENVDPRLSYLLCVNNT